MTAPSPIPQHSFSSDVAHSTAVSVVLAVVNAGTGILAARLLLPAGRGDLAAIFLWPTILSVVATLGMAESLVYFSAREPRHAGRLLGTSLVVSLGASAVLAAVGWVAMPLLLANRSDEVVTSARWYLLQVPIGAVLYLAARPLRGVGDIRAWNYLRTTHTAVWAVVLVAAWATGHATPGTIAVWFVVGRALLIAPTLVVVCRRLHQRLQIVGSDAGRLLRYGVPNTVASLPTILNLQLDQLVMAAFLPSRDLGLYIAAVSWSQIPTPVLVGFTTVFFPRVAGQADAGAQGSMAARGTRAAVLLSVALAAGAAVAAPIGVPLVFGTAFADAVPATVILCGAAAVLGVVGVLQEAARGLGRPMALVYSQLAGLAVTLAGLALLLARFGIVGAAVASVAGYTTVAAYLGRYNARLTKLRVADHLVPRGDDVRTLVTEARRLTRGRRAATS